MNNTRDTAPLVLGTEKIGKLLMRYAIPAIIAMTASSLYNMVDSIFIGHGVGPLAIAGLAITFPFMNLAAAFGSLVGVGASTLVAIKLGQKDKDGAVHVLGNVVMLNGIIGLIFMTVALLFLDPILLFFGASPDTLREGIYAGDFGGESYHAHIHGIERSTESFGVSSKGHGGNVDGRHRELRIGCLVYHGIWLGNPGSGVGNHCGTDYRFGI